MTSCAKKVLNDFSDLILAYGQSDEFSFVFRPDAQTYSRRSFKVSQENNKYFYNFFYWNP